MAIESIFIKDTINNNELVFIKSRNIKVFPCGRRKSELIDNQNTVSDRYYIPFDPEARLNTEANNRRHSGLYGYKQSYLNSWNSLGDVSIVLAGYLFNITSSYSSASEFGSAIATALGGNPNEIFVNIKLAEMKLFEGAGEVPAATTEILRDQSTAIEPAISLDKLNSDNYYFYGLSFSGENLEAADKAINNGITDWVSLHLLDLDNTGWKIHEASRLPVIDHGDTENSVKILGSLFIEDVLDENGNVITKGNTTVSGDLAVGGNINTNAVSLDYGNNISGYATILKVVNNQLRFWTGPKAED